MIELTVPELDGLRSIAAEGRPAYERIAAHDGIDPLDAAALVGKGLVGAHDAVLRTKEAKQARRDMLWRARREVSKRLWLAYLHTRRELEGEFGRCRCGRQGNERWPLMRRVDAEPEMFCFFCACADRPTT